MHFVPDERGHTGYRLSDVNWSVDAASPMPVYRPAAPLATIPARTGVRLSDVDWAVSL